MKYRIFILFVFFTFVSCEKMWETWYCIKIENTTTKGIFVSSGCARYGLFDYPDTTLTVNRPSLLQVNPNDHNDLRSGPKWEYIINEIPSDTLSIYIFDADTINAYDWSQIKEGYKVLKRYDLSVEDLKQKNWTVTYP